MAAPSKPSTVFAAIGILSHGAPGQRNWTRASFLSRTARRAAAAHGLVVRFVMRAEGASTAIQREADEHGDMVLVPAPANAGRASGPLLSLMLWWRHAVATWPSAQFIGKADDDVYIHLIGTMNHLAAAQRAVAEAYGHAEPRIYWGAFEAYHYEEADMRPVRFQQDRPGKCFRRQHNESGMLHGPFAFARGPLYFLSASLITTLLSDAWVNADLNRTLAALARLDSVRERRRSRRRGASAALPSMVWEDVYTGYLLSKVIAPTPPTLALVEHGVGNGGANPVYSDGFGMQLAPSTLIWHMRNKHRTAHRIAFAHHWLEESGRHCLPPPSSWPWVRCGYLRLASGRGMSTSCSGARWLRCTTRRDAYGPAACSGSLTELKHAADAWLANRSGVTPGGHVLV